MKQLNFLSPLYFKEPQNIKEYLTSAVDGYFALSNSRYTVVSKIDGNYGYEVKQSKLDQSKASLFLTSLLKIVSYMTVIIPMIMLAAKALLRSRDGYYLDYVKSDRNIFCFGDIHGELKGFKENLRGAGIIDGQDKWIRKSKATIVQMGDVVDRGPESREAWHFLSNLQREGRKNSCKVVRLIGNHEQMLLEGNFNFANYDNPEGLANEIRRDILSGRVQIAYTDGNRLFVHAGMRSKIKDLIVKEIKNERDGFLGYRKLLPYYNSNISLNDIADYLNKKLVEAVRQNNFSHPIFQVGAARGGRNSIGGVLWEDVSEMQRSRSASKIPQVIAHNPPRRAGDAPIRVSDSMSLINVDAGLCEVYGGNHGFAELRDREVVIHEQHRSFWHLFSREWYKRVLVDKI